jgi:hypothetical protein
MINELLEQAVKTGREVKAESAKRGEKMMAPTLIPYRGAEQVAVVITATEGSRSLVSAARLAITGFGADVLVLTFDTFHSTLPENPRTGKEWERGEMQELAEKHHGLERGWVTDAIHVMAVNRADDMVAWTLPYKKVSRHRLEWLDDTTFPHADSAVVKAQGFIPDALREAMSEPPLMLTMEQAGAGGAAFGLEPERAWAHSDLAVAQVLTRKAGCTVALQSMEGTVRAEVLKASKNTVKL